MAQFPDHPAIARTLSTGYPVPFTAVRCEGCGAEFSGTHKLYSCGGENLCESCAGDFLQGNFSLEEIAAALGIGSRCAAEIMEE